MIIDTSFTVSFYLFQVISNLLAAAVEREEGDDSIQGIVSIQVEDKTPEEEPPEPPAEGETTNVVTTTTKNFRVPPRIPVTPRTIRPTLENNLNVSDDNEQPTNGRQPTIVEGEAV